MNEIDSISIHLNEVKNHDDFQVAWACPDDIPNTLKNFVDECTKYDTCDMCVAELKKFKSERKFLIILTDFHFITEFESLPQTQAIYIWEKNDGRFGYKPEIHSKVVGIFDNIDDLIDRLRKDILLTYRCDLPITISTLTEIKIEQSLTNLHGNTLIFVWYQLFVQYLIQKVDRDMQKLKEDMLNQCRLDYETDRNELKKIDEFGKNSSSDNILTWYTKDSFLYRLLNKAFRTENIGLICKFRYALILLYEKFQSLSSKQQERDDFFVYRGQIINKHDLAKFCLLYTSPSPRD